MNKETCRKIWMRPRSLCSLIREYKLRHNPLVAAIVWHIIGQESVFIDGEEIFAARGKSKQGVRWVLYGRKIPPDNPYWRRFL